MIFCFLEGLYESVKLFFKSNNSWIWVSGHDYVEQKDDSLKCSRCFKISK